MPTTSIDVAIIGGGIAGAWALNLLRAKGYNAILLEADALGVGQTLASQGMIHGGLKYALSGALTGASEAIADMPRRWRACLIGQGSVDLSETQLLSEHYYMFANDSARGRLTTFFASKALRGRIDRVKPAAWPQEFVGFDGVVYLLNDFVLDTQSLLANLTRELQAFIFRQTIDQQTIQARPGGGFDITLSDITVHADHLVSCAGTGSEALINLLSIPDIAVQHRPLKQIIVRPNHDISMYAHCLTAISKNEPRLTITSHRIDGKMVWYIGGQLADRGVNLSDDEQVDTAQRELSTCVPWLPWHDAEFETLTVSRAEPAQGAGLRPDEAYVVQRGDFIQCFPTKLTLAPDLGDKLLALLPAPKYNEALVNETLVTQHPLATIGASPW